MKKRAYKNSGYSEGGGSYSNPALKNWQPRHFSSKSDIDLNLETLRSRSASLVMNSPIGSAILNAMLSGVLSTGLQLFPTPQYRELGLTAEAARRWSKRVQLEFNMWASGLNCDYYLRNNFYELQRVAFLNYLCDGDCFCLLKRRADSRCTLRLQLIESQRVSNPLNQGALINSVEMKYGNNRIVNGLEVDREGRLQAVWISNRIWNEFNTATPELEYKRVRFRGVNGNRNVLHICYDRRSEMFRGEPLLSPVIESIKQVARYAGAELTSAIIKSFFSLFFIQPASNFNLNEMLPSEEMDLSEYKLGSGTLQSLPRGVDVKAVESNNAQNTFDSFVTHFIKQIGAAVNIPYEVLMKNFQSSYSASRASILEAEKEFRQRRQAFINDFCQPIYEMWLTEAAAMGRIDAPGFFVDEFKQYCWNRASWRTEVSPSIDEVKQVNAAAKRIELGISTREIEAVKIGNDFYQNVENLKIEQALMEGSK